MEALFSLRVLKDRREDDFSVVVKFKVAWLCDLMIQPPHCLPSLAPGFRPSLPERRGQGWQTSLLKAISVK